MEQAEHSSLIQQVALLRKFQIHSAISLQIIMLRPQQVSQKQLIQTSLRLEMITANLQHIVLQYSELLPN